MNSQMWYRVALSQDEIAAGCLSSIRQQFAAAVNAAGEPDGACLFVINRDPGTGPFSEDTDNGATAGVAGVFFSPASVSTVPQILAQYKARPSAPPERACATLLVGKQVDWDLLPRAIH